MTGTLTAVVAQTALGAAGVALSDRGIRHATLFHATPGAARAELRSHGATEGNDPRAADVADRLARYTAGERDALGGFPLDIPEQGSFSHEVWTTLTTIPAGETRSYGWVARHLGRADAARAVGRAVGANPIPLWVPCHRVVASDGSLHGFGGGLPMKRRLLELEGAIQPALL